MTPPINNPDGSGVNEIVLPDGSTASEVIAPDGSTVWSAIPDTAELYYRLDDDSENTTAIDDVGYNDGVISGPTYDSNSYNGDFALSFSSTTDYVSIPDATAIPSDGDFTAVFAVQPNTPSSERNNLLSNNNGQSGRWVFNATDSGPGFFFADGLSSNVSMSTTLSSGQYSKVALRRDTDTFEIILDTGSGAFVDASLSESASLSQAADLQIGNRDGSSNSDTFNGLIDEPYIEKRAMSLSEIDDYPY